MERKGIRGLISHQRVTQPGHAAWRVSGASRAITFALVLLLCEAAGGPPRAWTDGHGRNDASATAGEPAAQLAAELLETIPEGTSIAVRPLGRRTSGLPEHVGERLYDELTHHLFRLATRVTILPREKLVDIYRTGEEFYDDTQQLHDLLRGVQADIEIYCEPTPGPDSVVLSCKGFDLRQESKVTATSATATFPLRRSVVHVYLAIASLADRIVQRAPDPGVLTEIRFIEQETACPSRLGRFIGLRLEASMSNAERSRRDSLVVTGEDAVPAAAPSRYRVEGVVWRLGDHIQLEVRLIAEPDGRNLSTEVEEVAVSSLPPDLVADLVGCRSEAVAEAVVSERLNRDSAVRAARNLARARVIAQALGLQPTDVQHATSEADAVAIMPLALTGGLTVEERFTEQKENDAGGTQRVTVRLAARVVPLSSSSAPEVTAKLDQPVYRARQDPISITIKAGDPAHLGLFSWGADDNIVRLYPTGSTDLEIDAGQSLVLPRPGEGYLLTAPMPGNSEDHEALVVVATRESSDFAALAPGLGDSRGSPQAATDFISALAGLDLARTALIVLPYRVRD